jgi:hypothetical protein
MNEKHYVLPPISNTPPASRDSNNPQTLTIITRRQSKIPILYSPTKSVQEYLSLNKTLQNDEIYIETTIPNPQYTDKWKFQYVSCAKLNYFKKNTYFCCCCCCVDDNQ